MNSQPPRTYTGIAVTIVAAAVIVAAAILATSAYTTTVTKTVPQYTTETTSQVTTTTRTTTVTVVITSTYSTPANKLYNVIFQQGGACSPPVYTIPWSVTLGNKTEAEPPNTPLPIANGSYSAGPEPPSLYTIVFASVPNGTYLYKIAPSGPFYITSGTVTVNGTDVSVPVEGPVVSCTTTTAG
jgi:hypothetical protein